MRDAGALLARQYGSSPATGPAGDWRRGEWPTLVRVVLEQGRSQQKDRDWAWVAETALRTAHDTAALTPRGLADILEAAGQPENKAAVLCELASWWQQKIPEADALDAFRSRSLEHWQNDLRAIRGVNWDLADRILLVVGGCTVYPLDRGSLRIAQRHGWMDAAAEYHDWQAFYVSSVEDSGIRLEQLWRWNVRVGREFCGRNPDCENCPLQTLLPARGPLEGEE
jgi:endonuclease-3 related protein